MRKFICAAVGLAAAAAGAAEYFVAKNGSDAGDGSSAAPWRTIQRAADVAKAGDTVTIREGVYREWVKPANAGRENAPIVYRAAKGEKVVVTGADPVGGWTRGPEGLWTVKLRYDTFGGLNPFTDTINGDWFDALGQTHFRTRLIQDGKPLKLHTRQSIIAGGNILEFKVIEEGNAVLVPGEVSGTIIANFAKDPNECVPELIVRPACFYPVEEYRDYITLRGISFKNAGPNWAPPTSEQVGIVGTNWSRGWTIEDCEISGAECSGITLGKYGDVFDDLGGNAQDQSNAIARSRENGLDRVGRHVIRRCRVTDCGQAGICGHLGGAFSTIDDCEISYCHWKKAFSGAEMAGIKIHAAIDFTISNCRIHHCGAHAGIWFDWMAQGARISGNRLWANGADLFFEVDHGPVLVEGNDLLSGLGVWSYSKNVAFTANRIKGAYRYSNDRRRTPVFKPHTAVIDSLDSLECTQGAFIYINNILAKDPRYAKEKHPSRYEDNWTVPEECWKIDETTGECEIAPPASCKAPDFKPVDAKRLGTAIFVNQEYPEPKLTIPQTRKDTLKELFENPPKEARAGAWWHWMGGQVTKAGIEKDLDWFVRMGITSATIFGMADATVPWAKRIANIPTGGMHPYDDEWWRLVKFACAEGKKRGIDIGLHNCPGYTSTGGKWISPRLAMRKLVFNVKDPAKDISLASEAPFPVYDEDKGKFCKPDCAARRTDYRKIAVVRGVEVGHIPSGSYIQPADWDSFGLECDKMNPESVSLHLDHVIAEWKKHLGPDLKAAGLTHVLLDSYEAGVPSWTPAMREEFKARRGYDCLDFLPILGGFTNLYTAAECAKFKKDFRRTVEDLYRDVLFKTMHEKLSAEGLQFSCEPYGGPWRTSEVAPYIDRMMTEFWHPGKTPNKSHRAFNTYSAPGGKRHNIVEAEAFTSGARWDETPLSLKITGDRAFLYGVNRMVLHSCVHQPWGDDVKPGVTMGRWGTHFGRNQTWAESGKAWFDYLARVQALLQWGRPATGRLKLPFGEIARTDGRVRVHFLVNDSDEEKPLGLRGRGRWFDPVTGETGAAPATLAPHQSGFWEVDVTREDAEAPEDCAAEAPSATPPQAIKIDGFSPAPGDWTESKDPEIRYFSGTKTYRATFDCGKTGCAAIDLGKVCCATAAVRLNGKDLGTVWCAPWRVKVPDGVLKAKGNVLEIDVTNTWRNRLIGDELEPPDVEFAKAPYPGGDMMLAYPDWFGKGIASRPSKGRKCFATWNYFNADAKDKSLMPSGLVGPVELRICGRPCGKADAKGE